MPAHRTMPTAPATTPLDGRTPSTIPRPTGSNISPRRPPRARQRSARIAGPAVTTRHRADRPLRADLAERRHRRGVRGETDEPFPHPDIDRAGVTARLVGRRARHEPEPAAQPATSMSMTMSTATSTGTSTSGDTLEAWLRRRGRPGGDHRRRGARRASRRGFDRHWFARRPPPARRAVGSAGRNPARRRPDDVARSVAVHTDAPEVASNVARGHVSGVSVFDNLPPGETVSSGGAGSVRRGRGRRRGRAPAGLGTQAADRQPAPALTLRRSVGAGRCAAPRRNRRAAARTPRQARRPCAAPGG